VGEVDQLDYAVDQRVAKGYQSDDGAVGYPNQQNLNGYVVQGHTAGCSGSLVRGMVVMMGAMCPDWQVADFEKKRGWPVQASLGVET
jgi:hypothetical protein